MRFILVLLFAVFYITGIESSSNRNSNDLLKTKILLSHIEMDRNDSLNLTYYSFNGNITLELNSPMQGIINLMILEGQWDGKAIDLENRLIYAAVVSGTKE